MNKDLPTDEPYGESWELHDNCYIDNGWYEGYTVGDMLREMRYDLVGRGNNPIDGMPLLVKLLSAEDWLSVQVHPNDAQARELEGDPRGKTEAWVILDADEGAQLVIGVQTNTTQEVMANAIRQNKLEDLLVYANVRAGDVLYIPANTVHAIGKGIVLYEIQQSSDTTYRLYDWGRMGLDGNPRELHIEKGVQVSNLTTLPTIEHPEGNVMVAGDYFMTARHRLKNEYVTIATAGRFQILTCIEGQLIAEGGGEQTHFAKGQTVLVPAALEAFRLRGEGVVLRSWQRG
jgi:mannose-6-phosphate isomerase